MICHRPANLPFPLNHTDHYWWKTDTYESGMGKLISQVRYLHKGILDYHLPLYQQLITRGNPLRQMQCVNKLMMILMKNV